MAGRQMWAPDAAYANGKYYLYFPVKNKQDVFQIGVAVSDKPEGPFTADRTPIKIATRIDPAFSRMTMENTICISAASGRQLQRWNNNKYDSTAKNRTKMKLLSAKDREIEC
jgi:beta-xylosidase